MAVKLGTVVNAPVRISQVFGDRPSYYAKYGYKGHPGLDLVANAGTIITAAHDGKCIEDGDSGDGYGIRVVLYNAELNIKSIYAHLQDDKVRKTWSYKEGDLIGHLGSTGDSTAPHLHFGVMRTKPSTIKQVPPYDQVIDNTEPLNSGNGYLGWEDPQDDNLWDWYRGYGFGEVSYPPGQAPPPTAPTPPKETKTSPWPVRFETAFPIIYPGWPEEGARADFAIWGEKKWKEHLASLAPKTTTPKAPADLGIPGQLELNTSKAKANYDKKVPGVYIRLGAEWIYATTGIPDFFPIGKSHFADNNGTQFAGLGGYIAVPIDGNNYEGYGQDRRITGDFFQAAGGNVSSVQVIAPPSPPPETAAPEEGAPVTPAPAGATIVVKSNPSKARFYIDGLYFSDLTPSNKPYPVTPGEHDIYIEKSGYKPVGIRYVVEENEQAEVEIDLEPEPGYIEPETAAAGKPKLTLALIASELKNLLNILGVKTRL